MLILPVDNTECDKGLPFYVSGLAHLLVKAGHSESLKRVLKCHPELIRQEFYVERMDKNKNLLTIAVYNGRTQCVQALVDAEADVNKRDRHGSKPIHFAVHSNNKECINMLLAYGADINVKNRKTKNTPLHIAAGGYKINSMQALIEAGAQHDARNSAKRTPLHIAVIFEPTFFGNCQRQIDGKRQ